MSLNLEEKRELITRNPDAVIQLFEEEKQIIQAYIKFRFNKINRAEFIQFVDKILEIDKFLESKRMNKI